MKILKFLGIFIIAILSIVLLSGLFIKKEFILEKEIVINKPRQEVFDYVKYLKNQNKFSYWATLDTNMAVSYNGTDATPGFIFAWKGNKKAGAGEEEITKIEEGKRIDYALRFKEPMESEMNSYITTEDAGANATKVTWAMYGTSKYPWNVMNPFMDAMMGSDLETGLSNLKKLMESK